MPMELKAGEACTEVLSFVGYREFEAAADRTATKIKEGYMEMGCILKTAKETDILAGSGYAGYEEFAYKRYGLDKGTVSRYIRIVERFSVDGTSNILKDCYKNMGFAKLSIMLHMPDAIAEELMDSLSKAEVQQIREEVEAENAVSDIERMIEAAEEDKMAARPVPDGGLLEKTLWQFLKEQPAIYRKLWKAYAEGREADIRDTLAPQGDAICMCRIPGMGRVMLSVTEEGVSATCVRTQEKEKGTMEGAVQLIRGLCPEATCAEEAYRETYGTQPPQEEEPKMAEVAPVQPSDGRRKETKRKESKVIKAAGVKEAAHAGEAPDVEERLPGQMNIGDYPGVVPEEDCPVSTYTVMEDGTAGQEPEETKQTEPEGQIPQECEILSGDAAPEDTEGIWMGIYKSHAELSKYLTVWEPQRALMEPDMVNRLYNMAVDMAAGFERLLLGRGGNG